MRTRSFSIVRSSERAASGSDGKWSLHHNSFVCTRSIHNNGAFFLWLANIPVCAPIHLHTFRSAYNEDILFCWSCCRCSCSCRARCLLCVHFNYKICSCKLWFLTCLEIIWNNLNAALLIKKCQLNLRVALTEFIKLPISQACYFLYLPIVCWWRALICLIYGYSRVDLK